MLCRSRMTHCKCISIVLLLDLNTSEELMCLRMRKVVCRNATEQCRHVSVFALRPDQPLHHSASGQACCARHGRWGAGVRRARLEAVAQRGEQLHRAAARRRLAARGLAGAAPALGQELRVPLVDERLAAHQVVLAQHHVPLRVQGMLDLSDTLVGFTPQGTLSHPTSPLRAVATPAVRVLHVASQTLAPCKCEMGTRVALHTGEHRQSNADSTNMYERDMAVSHRGAQAGCRTCVAWVEMQWHPRLVRAW